MQGAHEPSRTRGARLPVVDVEALVARTPRASACAEELGRACRDMGFFYAVNHGVDQVLVARLESLARRFFALDEAEKLALRMELGGRAWRGYFPLGRELTSGVPDAKQGLYFGVELGDDDPRVRARTPMHGKNLFPSLEGFREATLAYMAALTELGHALMRGLAMSLELDEEYFARRYTRDPLALFRIFDYPPRSRAESRVTDAAVASSACGAIASSAYGVGEHTDYGLLTMLWQDAVGGLEVRSRDGWIEAPPIEGSFVCNIGDMLDRMTRGLYRSTPHRVVNRSERERLSMAFFFDPSFDARIEPIETLATRDFVDDRGDRWDRASVHEFTGTYGEYLLRKVGRVFPELSRSES